MKARKTFEDDDALWAFEDDDYLDMFLKAEKVGDEIHLASYYEDGLVALIKKGKTKDGRWDKTLTSGSSRPGRGGRP
ncbi:MAG: hypothetical protein ACTSU5_20870 [Promethearchaeota archaeon]